MTWTFIVVKLHVFEGLLFKLVEGRAGEMMRMPHGDADKLTEEEIKFFKLWVNQGALNN